MSVNRKLQSVMGVVALALGFGLAATLSGGAGALPAARLRAAVRGSVVSDKNLPARTVKALKALGVSVSWPLATTATTVRAGSRLQVEVGDADIEAVSTRGQVTLSKISGATATTLASVPLGDVSGSSLSGWRLVLAIPRTAGTHYVLALTAGKVHYASRVRATEPAPGTVAAGPGTADAAHVSLSPSHTVPGETVAFSLENTGADTLKLTSLAWQREVAAGAWAPYAYGAVCCPVADQACPEYLVLARYAWTVTLGPGDRVSNTATVPPATADGSFRLAPNAADTSLSAAPTIALSSQPTMVTASARCHATTTVTPTTTVVHLPTATTATTITGPLHPVPQS